MHAIKSDKLCYDAKKSEAVLSCCVWGFFCVVHRFLLALQFVRALGVRDGKHFPNTRKTHPNIKRTYYHRNYLKIVVVVVVFFWFSLWFACFHIEFCSLQIPRMFALPPEHETRNTKWYFIHENALILLAIKTARCTHVLWLWVLCSSNSLPPPFPWLSDNIYIFIIQRCEYVTRSATECQGYAIL